MTRLAGTPPDPDRRAALASGLLYLVTFAASIPAALLLAPVLTDPAYITGPGADTQIAIACLLDLVNAFACIGSAVALFPVLRRYHESLALGFATTRLLEAAVIVPGVCALLAVGSIRTAGPVAGSDDAALLAVGQGLVGFRNWTFILGPSLLPGFNALMFATVLYRARLVPRWMPALGLVGAPMLIASVAGMVLGLHDLGSPFTAIATLPIFVWELSIGLWMTFRGFATGAGRSAVSGSGGTRELAVTDAAGASLSMSAAAAAPAAQARVTRLARLRLRPRRRHLLVAAGLWLAIVGNAEAQRRGIPVATVIAFSLLPSLPLLLGIGQPKRAGSVARRVVIPFNVTHEPLLPLALLALGGAGVAPVVVVAGSLTWLGAIVIAWGLGDGLRAADGSLRAGAGRLTGWRAWPVPSASTAAAAS